MAAVEIEGLAESFGDPKPVDSITFAVSEGRPVGPLKLAERREG